MAANGQKVGGIYVDLGINVDRLKSEIAMAKKEIDSFQGHGGKGRQITVSVKVNPDTVSVDRAAEKLRSQLAKGVVLTPKVSTNGVQSFVAGFRKDVNANGGILIKVKGLKIDGAALRKQAEQAIGAITITAKVQGSGGSGSGRNTTTTGPQTGGGSPAATGQSTARQQRAQERITKATEAAASIAEGNVRAGRPVAAAPAERTAQARTTAARTRQAKAEERIAAATETHATKAQRSARSPKADMAGGGPAVRPVSYSGPSGHVGDEYICPDCGKSFKSQASLNGHMRVTRGRARAQQVRAMGGSQQDVRDNAASARQADEHGYAAPAPVITGRPTDRPPANSATATPARSTKSTRKAAREEAMRQRAADRRGDRYVDPVTGHTVINGGGPSYPQRPFLSPEEQAEADRISKLPRVDHIRVAADDRNKGVGRGADTATINERSAGASGVRGMRLRPIGELPATHQAQAVAARGPGGILSQLTQARTDEMAAANETPRAKALKDALADVKGSGSFEALHNLDPAMAEALFAHMSGDQEKALQMSSEWDGEGIEGHHYTFGGSPEKAAKRLKSLRRAQMGKRDPYSIDPVQLLRAGFGNAIRSDITKKRRPTAALMKAGGPVAIQQSAEEFDKGLERQRSSRERMDDQALPTVDELLADIAPSPVDLGGGISYTPAAKLEEPDPEKEKKWRDARRAAPKIVKPSGRNPSAFASEQSALPAATIKAQADPGAMARAQAARDAEASRASTTPLDYTSETFGPLIVGRSFEHTQDMGDRGASKPGASMSLSRRPWRPRRTGSYPEPEAIFKGDATLFDSWRKGPEQRAEGGPVVRQAAGFLSRPFGAKSNAPEGHVNVARENSYAWQKLRASQIREQPWCSHCGVGRLEAKQGRNSLTADHIISQADGGDQWDPGNLQTLCGSCNSRKGYQSGHHGSWDKPRPKGLLNLPGVTAKDLLPNGRLFNVSGLREAAKRLRAGRADGGPVGRGFKAGGLLARLLQSTVDENGKIDASQIARSQALNVAAGIARGGTGESGGAMLPTKDWVRPASAAADRLLAYRQGRADGGAVSKEYLIGERGTELFEGKSGRSALIGQHGPKVMSFPEDGYITPHHKLPPGMAAGGNATGRQRYPAGTPFRAGGQFMSADAVQHVKNLGAAQILTGGSGPLKVQVTNFPAALTHPQQAAQSPIQGHPNQPVANQPTAGTQQQAGAPPAVNQPASTLAKPVKPGSISAEQRVAGREAAHSTVEDLRERLGAVQSGISESLQLAPVRALSVAAGQISQTIVGGRRGILERAGTARRLQGEAARATSQYGSEQERLQRLQAEHRDFQAGTIGNTPADTFKDAQQKADTLDVQQKKIDDQTKATEEARKIAETRTGEAETAQKGILTKPQVVRAQAAGLVGIVGGTLAFTGAMKLAQSTMAGLGEVVGNAAESIMDFAKTTTKATSDLAQQIHGAGGLAQVGVSRSLAGIGLGASVDVSHLREAATRQAGAENIKSQMDAIRADKNLSKRDETLGTFQGFGNGPLSGIPGLGWIGQTPGNVETLANNFKAPLSQSNLMNTLGGQQGPLGTPGAKGGGLVSDLASDFARGSNVIGNLFNGNAGNVGIQIDPAKLLEGAASTYTGAGGADAANGLATYKGISIADAQQQSSLKAINDDAKKFVDGADQLGGIPLKDVAKNLEPLRNIPGGGALADLFQAAHVGLKTKDGKLPTDQEWKAFFAEADKGANVPERRLLLDSMQPQIQAQIASAQRMAGFQRDTVLPAQFAMNQIANPLPTNPTVGIAAGNAASAGTLGGRFAGPDQATQDAVRAYGGDLAKVYSQLQTIGDQGQAALRKLGVPQDVIDSIKALAEANRSITERQTGEQLGLEQAQYNRQLMLSKRSLGDALGMQGRQAATVRTLVGYAKDGTAQYDMQIVAATKLGKLQREQLMLGRESNALSLAMSQRQLNFAIALSRINTPGSTPIERASRARDADILNRDAQKQLDISKKQFSGTIQIDKIQFSRSAEQAQADLKNLTAGRAVQIDVRGGQKLIDANNQLIGYQQQIAGTYSELGVNYQTLINTTQSELEAATGKASATFDEEVDKNIGSLVKKYQGAFGTLLGTSTTGSGSGTGHGNPAVGNQGAHAMGTIFDTRGATSMVVGEAQGERVAVLRNPRRVGLGGYGGGGGGQNHVAINISGNWQVRSDSDVMSIADQVARQVEDRLNRRAAVFATTSS